MKKFDKVVKDRDASVKYPPSDCNIDELKPWISSNSAYSACIAGSSDPDYKPPTCGTCVCPPNE